MINKDPFGGVSSELESNSPSPFKIDKEEALKQIQKSLELWDKKKVKKKSFLQKLREKNKSDDNIKAPHWEYSKKSRDYVNIHLLWSKTIIRTLSNVPIKQVRVALNGLKAFSYTGCCFPLDKSSNTIAGYCITPYFIAKVLFN